MSLSKAVLSGVVYRAPEKRFTSNNVPITFFTLNIDEKDETLIRVVAKGNLAEIVEGNIAKSDKVVVEGRLQNSVIKAEDGTEKKIVEVDLASFEKISGSAVSSKSSDNEQIVKFAEEDFSDDLIGEEEIPF